MTMASSPSPEVPLSIEPVLGWRVWRLARHGGKLRLKAYAHDTVWPPQQAARATCGRGQSHAAPQLGCTCGFYAADSIEALAAAGVFSGDTCVIGAIAMWGKTIEHDRGARSEYAYPARLRIVCAECLSTGKFRDPAVVPEQGALLEPRCVEHARGASGLEPTQVLAELLSTYAVDLLPEPKLPWWPHPIATAASSPRPARTVAEWILIGVIRLIGFAFQALITLWILSLIIGIVVSIAGGVIGVFIGHDQPSPTAVAKAPSWTHLPELRSAGAGPLQRQALVRRHAHSAPTPPPLPEVGLPCGIGHGDVIELVPCRDPESDLFGWAERTSPRGADEDCASSGPYSHGPHWWVCWFAPQAGAWVHPWPDSPNPFTTPVKEGGLDHGDR
jgi:hypothetical protein